MKARSLSAIVLILSLWSGQGSALVLSLEPSTQSVTVAESTTVDLIASDLGGFAPPSIGAFFVELLFDDSILSLDAVDYGPHLGDPSDPFETDIITISGIGFVSLDEFSFLFDFELDAIQPASFPLATLTFSALSPGTSALNFGLVDASDAIGFSLDPVLLSSEIVVREDGTVPIPGSAPLVLLGLATIWWRQAKA